MRSRVSLLCGACSKGGVVIVWHAGGCKSRTGRCGNLKLSVQIQSHYSKGTIRRQIYGLHLLHIENKIKPGINFSICPAESC